MVKKNKSIIKKVLKKKKFCFDRNLFTNALAHLPLPCLVK